MFAEFTQLDNWNYDFDANPHAYRFFELFDTTADPWQTTNIYYTNASTSMKKALHELVVSNFRCQRSECFKPIKFQLNEDGSNGLHAPVPTLDNLDFNRAWNSPSKSTESKQSLLPGPATMLSTLTQAWVRIKASTELLHTFTL